METDDFFGPIPARGDMRASKFINIVYHLSLLKINHLDPTHVVGGSEKGGSEISMEKKNLEIFFSIETPIILINYIVLDSWVIYFQ